MSTENVLKRFAGGVPINDIQFDEILAGKQTKKIHCASPGLPLIHVLNNFATMDDGTIDAADPYLIAILKKLGLPLEKTFIIQVYKKTEPFFPYPKGLVFGYW